MKGEFLRVGGVNMEKENLKKEWGSEKGGVKERVQTEKTGDAKARFLLKCAPTNLFMHSASQSLTPTPLPWKDSLKPFY